jgi:hypothetical protein
VKCALRAYGSQSTDTSQTDYQLSESFGAKCYLGTLVTPEMLSKLARLVGNGIVGG